MVPLHPFRPRLLDSLRGYSRRQLLADAGAGLTVGVVALPLALAFAIASGVKPEQGLATAIIAGFLISALGGSNVQIGGPAGAFIVIVYGIVQRYGLANLLIATMLAGVLLLALGALRLGALVRYIPVSIVIGFTNGIAVLIALSQLKDLLGLHIAQMPADFFGQLQALGAHLHQFNPLALLMGLACAALVLLWPRLPARLQPLPPTLVALVAAGLAAWGLQLPLETIGSRFGGIPAGLPDFAWPALEWQSRDSMAPSRAMVRVGMTRRCTL
ncbi:SulP family inorganic anion transporter, partial [Roseateles sp.]|uniref:SulP family inorganic anion transporter n=1 Tax=Roseateles sp. TaxID=1971397 RepID=UPI00391B2FAE